MSRRKKIDAREFDDLQRLAHIHEVMGDLHQDIAKVQLFIMDGNAAAAGEYLLVAYLKIQEAARTFREIEQ